MARSRNIKPGFFTNPEVVEVTFETRLLFIALWTLADREGRLEDRPKKIKMAAFPADNLDVDSMLNDLQEVGLIYRYKVGNQALISIPNFGKHQSPHHKEPASTLPAPGSCPSNDPDKPETNPGVTALIPDSGFRIPDSLQGGQQADRFPDWWSVYPRKRKKKTAREIWKRKKLDKQADTLIADVRSRLESDQQWIDGFIPDPTTYLNQERWEDEFTKAKPNGAEKVWQLTDDQLIRRAQEKGIGTQGKTRQQLIAALEAR